MSTKKGGLSVMGTATFLIPGRPCRYPLNPSKEEEKEQVQVMVMVSNNDPQILINRDILK